jgi:hypothetical protein
MPFRQKTKPNERSRGSLGRELVALIGDTFTFASVRVGRHLHIIISDPAKDPHQIVTANFTTCPPQVDKSCVVSRKDHSFLRHQSYVWYGQNRLLSLALFESSLNSGALILNDPVSQELLKRILNGASVTQHIPIKNLEILQAQGLLDDT